MVSERGGIKARGARIGIAAAAVLLLVTGVAAAGGSHDRFTPGAAGAGDAYFPLDGNGGYDTKHYLLDLKYNPATDVLEGTATIRARATQNLSRFNLDFDGMTVLAIEIDGRRASWRRDGAELIVTPRDGLRDGHNFTIEVKYRGVPETLEDGSGFIHTDDGALIIGEPHVAATWYPVNDHPSDKAAYTTKMTVPAGLEAVGNGELEGRSTKHGWTTWTWDADEPMASYLLTASVGQFDLRSYRHKGIKLWDAFDPDLWDPTGAPRTGTQFAISQQSSPSYKRLMRTIAVPAGGANLTFWINRDTEPNWDYVFVEAHAAGSPVWTTLRDLNGHTTQATGNVCPFWLGFYPFLEHYQTDNGDDTCSPTGDTGQWWAASGSSNGYEQWRVDLGAYAGTNAEVSISYASDTSVQLNGAFVDDIVVSTGVGSTSFEADGNTFDGWTVPGAPAGSPANPNDWIAGTTAQTPPPVGTVVDQSFARQGEILDFESGIFGSYPFSASGGIVDDLGTIGFALENQTRPIYAKGFFSDTFSGDSVIVHELAHQWFGDSLAVKRWSEIWLNEGFATYAEWLWSDAEGLGTTQELFDFYYDEIWAPDDPFWQVIVGDPGPDLLFDNAIYYRGAMTLHQLRLEVGDRDFFKIIKTWAQTREGDNVKISEFIRLAEQISRDNLDPLFDTWLFTAGKPVVASASSARSSLGSLGLSRSVGAWAVKPGLARKLK